MTEHAEYMLSQPDQVLFAHKACHVFASALRHRFCYPLLLIASESGRPGGHVHVACVPEPRALLDVFGWFTFSEYRQEEALTESISFREIREAQLKDHFTQAAGAGLSDNPIFVTRCRDRADAWIQARVEYYDGRVKHRIPGVSRLGVTVSRPQGGLYGQA